MQMEKKQFVVIFFTILAFLFLGYEVFRLVSDDIDLKIESKNSPVDLFQPPMAQKADPPPAPAPIKLAVASTNALIQKKEASITAKTQESDYYKKTYLELINLYELAKMKRQLLEEEAAIAEAQQRIAEINKGTQRISQSGNLSVASDASNDSESSYVLSYIDKQNGQWSAVLKKDGVYQTVTVGSLLPDHYQVASINEKGVILKNNKQEAIVTFNGMTALTESKVQANQSPPLKKEIALKTPLKPLLTMQTTSTN